ncbi:MAG: TIGR01777 family protein [Crocinitomicaceae bacterium]|nr:TIGR01777 family protein [Crocinitomicaceae bacterium]|tara:strand:- start:39117 stop:39995 length:879 start_codon:yes stop_codon:yes gene_type:complete
MNFLIAGGTGLIGQELRKALLNKGHNVFILSRTNDEDLITWDIKSKNIERKFLDKVEVVINLCGEGIADKRWTKKRRQELKDSRVETTKLLFSYRKYMPNLKHYISASGITCYGSLSNPSGYNEKDSFGNDYISSLVKEWESAAELFTDFVPTTKIRMGIVLTKNGGAIEKMIKPIRFGLGSVIASGEQIISWIHIDDLISLFIHVIEKKLIGTFNAISQNTSNREFINDLANSINKKIFLPAIPAIFFRFIFGEMSTLLINGVHISNHKIRSTGFRFKYSNLNLALKDLKL